MPPHNEYLETGDQIDGGTVLTGPKHLEYLDQMSVEGAQGDNGGVYVPATPIGVGGQGITFSVCALQGGVQTQAGGRLRLDDSDWPTFPARTRTTVLRLTRSYATGRFAATANGLFTESVDGSLIYVPIPPRLLQQNATLSTVSLKLRVGLPHAAVPATFPALTIVRQTASGTQATLGTAAMTAASGDAYFNNGAVQTLVCPCASSNVIDLTAYNYIAQITDEHGSGALPSNLLVSLTFGLTNILDMRF